MITYEEKNGIEPYIQLITHSHGGNIALNLAEINNSETPLSIDELILLACPVQYKTSHLIHNSMFKKAYSLYSHWDINQIIDAQGWEPLKERVKNLFMYAADQSDDTTEKAQEKKCFFSERRFQDDQKLIQSNIQYGIRGMLHHEFLSESFMQQLPTLLSDIDAQKNLVSRLRIALTYA